MIDERARLDTLDAIRKASQAIAYLAYKDDAASYEEKAYSRFAAQDNADVAHGARCFGYRYTYPLTNPWAARTRGV